MDFNEISYTALSEHYIYHDVRNLRTAMKFYAGLYDNRELE